MGTGMGTGYGIVWRSKPSIAFSLRRWSGNGDELGEWHCSSMLASLYMRGGSVGRGQLGVGFETLLHR